MFIAVRFLENPSESQLSFKSISVLWWTQTLNEATFCGMCTNFLVLARTGSQLLFSLLFKGATRWLQYLDLHRSTYKSHWASLFQPTIVLTQLWQKDQLKLNFFQAWHTYSSIVIQDTGRIRWMYLITDTNIPANISDVVLDSSCTAQACPLSSCSL